MNSYYQIVPENVYTNLAEIHSLLSPGIKGYSPDCLTEVISTIACQIRKEAGPVPISTAYINKLVPQGQCYLKGLIDLGIIVRSGRFIPGEVCYKYEFAPEYQSKYITIALTNMKLVRRIRMVWDEVRGKEARTIRGRSEQVMFLKKLTIAKDYREYLDQHFLKDTHQYNCLLQSAIRIENGDHERCKIDDTSGRFHSIITNLSKELRPFLRINGEPLVNVDVRNSQPYLSTILLTDPGKVAWMTKNTAFALLLQSLKVSVNKSDVKIYISLVITGQLYEFLMQEFTKEGLILTRGETKTQVLRILFARNRLPKDECNRKARLIFRNRFPTVHRIFSKVRGSEKGDRFQNFSRFAILLQRIESYLMLDVILKRIYRELPGTIAVTIHDSIMTGILTNNVEAVMNIMIQELQNFVGFRPQLKIEGLLEDKEEGKGEAVLLNHYVITNSVSHN